MRRLLGWYDHRIVNVNVNVLLAGAIALVITVAIMHALERTGLLAELTSWAESHRVGAMGYEVQMGKVAVSGLTLIVDLVADVAVYYGLHWLANHMPGRRHKVKTNAYADLTFVRDATLVQFERALLSPVLYAIALTIQNKMLHEGWGVAWATGVGFAVGIILCRLIHTLWMIRAEREAGRRSAADVVGPDRATDAANAGSERKAG